MAQHAELGPPRQRLGTEREADADQPDHDRHRLQDVGHGEGAVEVLHRQLLERQAGVDLQRFTARHPPPKLGLDLPRRDAGL